MGIQVLIVAIVAVLIKCIDSQTLPANPCPNLFQYYQNNGMVYGRMEFPNDLSGYYRLTVNMSVAAYLTDNKNIRLELKSTTNDILGGLPVVYFVYFPIQGVLPKPTRIEFNRIIYCSGPPEELRPGGGVTNMWATTYFGLTGPIRPARPNIIDEILTQPAVPTNSPKSSIFTITPARPITINEIITQPQFSTNSPEAPIFTSRPASSGSTETLGSSPPSAFSVNAFFLPSTSTPSTIPDVVERNPPDDQQCGVSSVITQELVVNGDAVKDGQYPWMVAIMYSKKSDYKYRCTGSLVSNRHVVTAAHCVYFYKAPLFPNEDLLLVLGKHNIQNWANGAVLRDVEKVTGHPDYQQGKGPCDVAVITMARQINFETSVRPVCLWQEDEELDKIVGASGTVVGWGRDETGKNFVTDAKKTSLPVVSQVDCLRSHAGFTNITSSRTFCAGNRDGSGPCTGDSGAGFVMRRNGKWTLRGVVSIALGDLSTCDLQSYFVFADVAKIITWIREAMA